MPSRTVILVNLGTTRTPDADGVRAFLGEFLSDPMVVDYPRWFWMPILRGIILRSRPEKVARMYQAIWSEEGSPLDVETRAMTDRVSAAVGADIEIRYAYRYGEPNMEGELRRARGESRGEVVIVPLFPQRTGSTTGTVEVLVRRLASQLEMADRVGVEYVAPDDDGYISAQADRWNEAIGKAEFEPNHVVVSFHGIPKRYDRAEGSMYRTDCDTTYRALLHRIGWPERRATLTYQSKFGPEPWISPATADVIAHLGRAGTRSVAVMTPGFLTEGLETIEEIGIRGRKIFREAGGGEFVRVGCAGAHPALIESLAAVSHRP